ncbi:little elongation complex subunit 1 [Bombina bombina]|uniref:little elongation complex subunit 1 n=1 Tax=Bombina bombina TaxID=8345 RepID=UPI00235B1486|nr:little elongation complex subunit 1 [Bombina bombina]
MMPGETHSKAGGIASEAAGTCQNCTALQQNLNEYVAALIALKQKIIDSDHLLTEYQQKCDELQFSERENDTLRRQLEQMLQKMSCQDHNTQELQSLREELEEKMCTLKIYQQTQLEYTKVQEECAKSDLAKKKLEVKLKKMEEAATRQFQDLKKLKHGKRMLEKELKKAQKRLSVYQRKHVRSRKAMKHAQTQIVNEPVMNMEKKRKMKLLLQEVLACLDSSDKQNDTQILDEDQCRVPEIKLRSGKYFGVLFNQIHIFFFTERNIISKGRKQKSDTDCTMAPSHSSPLFNPVLSNTTALSVINVPSESSRTRNSKNKSFEETAADCNGDSAFYEDKTADLSVPRDLIDSYTEVPEIDYTETDEFLAILEWARPLPPLLSPVQFSPSDTKGGLFGEFTDSSEEDSSVKFSPDATMDYQNSEVNTASVPEQDDVADTSTFDTFKNINKDGAISVTTESLTNKAGVCSTSENISQTYESTDVLNEKQNQSENHIPMLQTKSSSSSSINILNESNNSIGLDCGNVPTDVIDSSKDNRELSVMQTEDQGISLDNLDDMEFSGNEHSALIERASSNPVLNSNIKNILSVEQTHKALSVTVLVEDLEHKEEPNKGVSVLTSVDLSGKSVTISVHDMEHKEEPNKDVSSLTSDELCAARVTVSAEDLEHKEEPNKDVSVLTSDDLWGKSVSVENVEHKEDPNKDVSVLTSDDLCGKSVTDSVENVEHKEEPNKDVSALTSDDLCGTIVTISAEDLEHKEEPNKDVSALTSDDLCSESVSVENVEHKEEPNKDLSALTSDDLCGKSVTVSVEELEHKEEPNKDVSVLTSDDLCGKGVTVSVEELEHTEEPNKDVSVLTSDDLWGKSVVEHKEDPNKDVSVLTSDDLCGTIVTISAEDLEHKEPNKYVSALTSDDLCSKSVSVENVEHKEDPNKDVSALTSDDLCSKSVSVENVEHKEDPNKDVSALSSDDLCGKSVTVLVEELEHKEEPNKDVSVLTSDDLCGKMHALVKSKDTSCIRDIPTHCDLPIDKFPPVDKSIGENNSLLIGKAVDNNSNQNKTAHEDAEKEVHIVGQQKHCIEYTHSGAKNNHVSKENQVMKNICATATNEALTKSSEENAQPFDNSTVLSSILEDDESMQEPMEWDPTETKDSVVESERQLTEQSNTMSNEQETSQLSKNSGQKHEATLKPHVPERTSEDVNSTSPITSAADQDNADQLINSCNTNNQKVKNCSKNPESVNCAYDTQQDNCSKQKQMSEEYIVSDQNYEKTEYLTCNESKSSKSSSKKNKQNSVIGPLLVHTVHDHLTEIDTVLENKISNTAEPSVEAIVLKNSINISYNFPVPTIEEITNKLMAIDLTTSINNTKSSSKSAPCILQSKSDSLKNCIKDKLCSPVSNESFHKISLHTDPECTENTTVSPISEEVNPTSSELVEMVVHTEKCVTVITDSPSPTKIVSSVEKQILETEQQNSDEASTNVKESCIELVASESSENTVHRLFTAASPCTVEKKDNVLEPSNKDYLESVVHDALQNGETKISEEKCDLNNTQIYSKKYINNEVSSDSSDESDDCIPLRKVNYGNTSTHKLSRTSSIISKDCSRLAINTLSCSGNENLVADRKTKMRDVTGLCEEHKKDDVKVNDKKETKQSDISCTALCSNITSMKELDNHSPPVALAQNVPANNCADMKVNTSIQNAISATLNTAMKEHVCRKDITEEAPIDTKAESFFKKANEQQEVDVSLSDNLESNKNCVQQTEQNAEANDNIQLPGKNLIWNFKMFDNSSSVVLTPNVPATNCTEEEKNPTVMKENISLQENTDESPVDTKSESANEQEAELSLSDNLQSNSNCDEQSDQTTEATHKIRLPGKNLIWNFKMFDDDVDPRAPHNTLKRQKAKGENRKGKEMFRNHDVVPNVNDQSYSNNFENSLPIMQARKRNSRSFKSVTKCKGNVQNNQIEQTVLANADTSTKTEHSPETLNKVRSEMGPPLPPLLGPLIATPPRSLPPLSPVRSSSSRSSLPSPLDDLISPLRKTPVPPLVSPLSDKKRYKSPMFTTPSPSEKANRRILSSPLQFCAATPKHALPVPGRLPPSAAANSTPNVQENSVKILDTMYPELSARARTLNILKGNIQLNRCLPGASKAMPVNQITGFKTISSSSTAFSKTGSNSKTNKDKPRDTESQRTSSNSAPKRGFESGTMPKSAKRLRLESPVTETLKVSLVYPSSKSISKAQGTYCSSDKLVPENTVPVAIKDEDTVANALKKVEELCFDLLPVIRSHVFVGTIPSVPVMRNEEKEVISEFIGTKKILVDNFLNTILMKLKTEKASLDHNYLQALCRVYVGLCRQLGDLERARILCYSILKEDFPEPDKLVLFVISTWSDLLSVHGVMNKAMHALLKQITEGEVLKCLSAYLNWEKTPPVSVSIVLSSVLMAVQFCPDVKFQHSEKFGEDLTDSIWEYVFAVDLLCNYQKWIWSHDNVISKELWPILDKWVKRKKGNITVPFVPDVIVATVLRMVGYLCRMGLKEGFMTAVKNISSVIVAFIQHAKEEDMPWGVQLAAVYMLFDLAPSDSDVIHQTLQAWRKTATNNIPPAVTTGLTNLASMCSLEDKAVFHNKP